MKVAIDARMIRCTGIGRYIRNLLGRLPLAGPDNLYSAVCSEPFAGNGAVRSKRTLLPTPIYSLREQALLPIEVMRHSADLVHYPSFNMPAVSAIPAVVTMHDLYYLRPGAGPGPAARLYARLMFRVAAVAARRIITVSEFSRRDILARLGVSPWRVKVVYQGVEESYRPADSGQVRLAVSECGIGGEYLLYVGGHRPNKNIGALIQAFALLGDRGLSLVIAGKVDPRRKELYSMPQRLGIGDRVRFVGEVPEERLPGLYSGASLFVFPSLFEGFGLPPLEAMACGAPVVCSSAASLPEVAGDAALYFDPLDAADLKRAMKEALGSASLRSEMRQKGLERARLFDWGRTASETIEVYKEALG